VVTEARARILYVDDEPTLVFPVTRALERLGIASGCIDPAEVRGARRSWARRVIASRPPSAELAPLVRDLAPDS
jgi:hypothetical protein